MNIIHLILCLSALADLMLLNVIVHVLIEDMHGHALP